MTLFLGMNYLWSTISSKYCGILRKIVEDYVRNCHSCIVGNPLKTHDFVRNITATQCWERIQIDLIDLRQYATANDGFCWILHVIDVYSRFSFVFKTKCKTASEVSLFEFNFLG